MTQSNIPQYHHSYSEDENLSIYKYLKSATNKNLVENIFILCQSYPEEHQKNIIEALLCTFRINGAPFPRQRCKRLAPAVRYPFVVTC